MCVSVWEKVTPNSPKKAKNMVEGKERKEHLYIQKRWTNRREGKERKGKDRKWKKGKTGRSRREKERKGMTTEYRPVSDLRKEGQLLLGNQGRGDK